MAGGLLHWKLAFLDCTVLYSACIVCGVDDGRTAGFYLRNLLFGQGIFFSRQSGWLRGWNTWCRD